MLIFTSLNCLPYCIELTWFGNFVHY